MSLSKLILLFFAVFWFPLNTFAELPEQMKSDFAPREGIIIMPVGDEFLIDLDVTSNLKEGDILSLTAPGNKIIHPVTKEILGSLDEVRGFLQVTRVKSGYSYVKVITAQTTPEKGDHVKRFESVPATVDQTLANTELEDELKYGLPQLNWLEETASETPLLEFSLKQNQLQVKDIEGVIIKIYSYASGNLSAPLNANLAEDSSPLQGELEEDKSLLNKTVAGVLGAVGLADKEEPKASPGIIQNQQATPVWTGPNLGANPVGITVNDFDNDGQQEIAVAMEDHLRIYRLAENQLNQIAKIDFPGGIKLLSIDCIDLNKNGFPELYLTAHIGNRLSSQRIEFKQDNYDRTEKQIPWFLRVVDLPDEGPTLIAQTMGSVEEPFAEKPFRVSIRDGKLARGENLQIGNNLNLFSFMPLKGTSHELYYTTIRQDDYLTVVSAEGGKVWEAGEHYGGTEEYFYNKQSLDKEITYPIYIQKRLLSLPSGEILIPQNDGPRAIKRFRNFKNSRIIAMEWNGFSLVKSWQTTDLGGYLSGFYLGDADNDSQQELVVAIKYKEKNIFQKGRSTIVIYELN